MSKSPNTSISVWQPNQPISLPATAGPGEIAAVAAQLSARDRRSIVSAFESESYEMVSTFVWTRAIASLKKQIATLGMEFVGEMLRRQDISETSDPLTAIGDSDALSLAEDLGMVSTTDALRLKHALELVSHFSDPDTATDSEMADSEAVSILRACVTSILGNQTIVPPLEFAALRQALEERTLKRDSAEVSAVLASPYFFQRTTLSVLLSLAKSAEGAHLEHAIGNINVILPELWGVLRQPERWQVGQTYSEVANSGARHSTAGLKKALLSVQGFDYVPESLRSRTFSQAAHRVTAAHFATNNFYNEREPMDELAKLGTTIPKPAFPVSMTAILCVRLGNQWGHAWDAQSSADAMLGGLRREQWEYFVAECLADDKAILEKLSGSGKPLSRWIELAEEFDLKTIKATNKDIKSVCAGDSGKAAEAARAASRLRSAVLK